ncbi:Translation initiation factor eIF-2B subunit gamma, partial [Stegodyphus mimosarum]
MKMMEFQAIIMAAGTGSRMREITSAHPKCLLPIGNIPLILCSLNVLKRTGFSEVIVLIRENEKAKIQNAIEGKLDIKLDIVTIPKNEDWGTADSLRHIKDKIKRDVLVISCDIVTDINIQNILMLHRSQGSSLTVLLVPFPKALREIDMPGSKKKCKFERDIIGIDSSGRLTFLNSEADFEEGVPLKLSTLKQNPLVTVYSNLMDVHLYVIKKDLISFIVNNEHLSTLKGEFLPAAVKKQFTVKKEQKTEPVDASLGSSILNKDWIDLKQLALDMSSWKDPSIYLKPAIEEELKCFAYVEKEFFCSRVNNLVAYIDINRKISKHFYVVTGMQTKLHQYQKSQVDADSIIGDNCELQAKSMVKQSVIGNNCKLNEKAKISNSVVMDNVQFGKDCIIQGSIICSNVKIEDGCSLKNCIVG